MFESLCGQCSHKNCCTDSAVPLVFSSDLQKIKEANPKYLECISTIKVNGILVKAIKKKENSKQCVFWDNNTKGCGIYESRPIDCRLYPFDILLIENSFHWIVYSCNSESDWGWSEKHLETLEQDRGFRDLIKNFDVFSDHTKMILPSETAKTPYTILRKVKLPTDLVSD